MRVLALVIVVAAAAWAGPGSRAAPPDREQAIAALANADAAQRLEGVGRLADVGTMADAHLLLARLADPDRRVRAAANEAIWQLWSRSGDAATDALFQRGVAQMQAGALTDALATFDTIVRQRPEFAEGWNKRATLYFLLGQNEKSLADCDEVLRRNPDHFGALSGAGQIQLKLGQPRRALDFFRRALELNPTLDGLAEIISMLEDVVRRQERQAA